MLLSIQDRTVCESHLNANYPDRGLSGLILFDILSNFHKLNCMWTKPNIPTSKGIFERYVEIRLFMSKIFVP